MKGKGVLDVSVSCCDIVFAGERKDGASVKRTEEGHPAATTFGTMASRTPSAPPTVTNRHRITLLLVFVASTSCALFYITFRQPVVWLSISRQTRLIEEFNNSSTGIETSDADGLLIEIAVKRDTPENRGSAMLLTQSRSINVQSKSEVHVTKALVESTAEHPLATGLLQLNDPIPPNGIETKDANGLLVEVAAQHAHASAFSNNTITAFAGDNPKQTKIINGMSTSRAKHPFIVRIHSSNPGINPDDSSSSFFCGGTLISPDIIATAAHCIGDDEYVDIYSVQQEKTRTHKIVKRLIHPKYKKSLFGNDFALIQIENEHLDVTTRTDENGRQYWDLLARNDYDWKNSPPIMRLHRYDQSSSSCTALSRAQSKRVTTLTVLGYGRVAFPNGPISYSSLRSADVHYLSNEGCNSLYSKAPPKALPTMKEGDLITNDMLCANDTKEKQDACSGDSGGPLLAKLPMGGVNGGLWSLVGIISWGIGCAVSAFPGVYSRVAAEMEWMQSTICDKDNGLSPLSCVIGNDGSYHLRDYAAEALTKDTNEMLLQRQPVSDTSLRSSSSSRLVRKRIHLTLSFNTEGIFRQSRVNKMACELLEGTTLASSFPPRPPISRPQNSRPTKVEMGLTVTCPDNNTSDVRYFMDENNKVRECLWVKSMCGSRCVKYSTCCPVTCSQSRCQK
jgi:secreted trypsin-like serine protease